VRTTTASHLLDLSNFHSSFDMSATHVTVITVVRQVEQRSQFGTVLEGGMSGVATRHLRVAEPGVRLIDVVVNNQPVALPLDLMSGMEIKLEAMAQGAELEAGFALSVWTSSCFREVEDEDVLAVRAGQEFVAIAADDNS
jgi:hypothetical protein